jgi:hypothetical protein
MIATSAAVWSCTAINTPERSSGEISERNALIDG